MPLHGTSTENRARFACITSNTIAHTVGHNSSLESRARRTGVAFCGHKLSGSRTTIYHVMIGDAVTQHRERLGFLSDTRITVGETMREYTHLKLRAWRALHTE